MSSMVPKGLIPVVMKYKFNVIHNAALSFKVLSQIAIHDKFPMKPES